MIWMEKNDARSSDFGARLWTDIERRETSTARRRCDVAQACLQELLDRALTANQFGFVATESLKDELVHLLIGRDAQAFHRRF